MTRLLKLFSVLLFATGCLATSAAYAVTSATSSPATARINDAGSTVVTIRWRVGVSLTSGVPTSIVVSSPSGALGIGGTPGGMISKTIRHPGTGVVFATFNERLRVSRTTARRITQVGSTTYSRTFSDNNGPGTAAASVRVQTSSGGALSFRNFALSFDDDSAFRVLGQNESLTARLELTTNGKGILEGAWEVSGPSSTQGSGFRPLRRVRQVLAGSRRTIFESPNLPTDRIGTYRLRFVPNSGIPRGSNEIVPEITYSVTRSGVSSQLDLISPGTGSSLTLASRFTWRSVPGAASYRLEFLSGGAGGIRGDRLAALDVKSARAKLRPTTLARLASDTEVYWRVTAYDSAGRKIATSAIRRAKGGAASQTVQ